MFSIFIDSDSLPKPHRAMVIRRILKDNQYIKACHFASDRVLPDVRDAIEHHTASLRAPLRDTLEKEELRKIRSNIYMYVVETGMNSADDKLVELSEKSTSAIELETLYEQRDDCTITAPSDGVLSKVNVTEGSFISSNQAAAVITDYSKLKINIKIGEYDIGNAHVGDEVDIYINALDRTVKGKVDSISSQAENSGGVSYFYSDIVFDSDEDIRAGMSVQVKLISKRSDNTISVLADAVNYKDDNTAFVLIKGADGVPQERIVTVGISDGTYTEITDGLSENDVVVYIPGVVDYMSMMW